MHPQLVFAGQSGHVDVAAIVVLGVVEAVPLPWAIASDNPAVTAAKKKDLCEYSVAPLLDNI